MRPGSYVRAFDFKAGFYQIPIPEDVQSHFAFRIGKKYFCINKLPMGVFFALEIMHTVVLILAHGLDTDGVTANIHIDNIRFHGTNDAIPDVSFWG